MPSYFIADQESICRYVSVIAQVSPVSGASSTNPSFTFSVDGVQGTSQIFTSGYEQNKIHEFQLFPSIAVSTSTFPATGITFQISAQNAVIKDCRFSVEPLAAFTSKQLFHGVKIGYIGTPQFNFYLDGTTITPTTPTTLTSSSNSPSSATLYFPAMKIGFAPHFTMTSATNAVASNLLSGIQFLSVPVDM